MDLVRELSLDSILYMPGPEVVTSTTNTSRSASLNRVLRKIYPRGTTPKVTDLIAFLDDDQVFPLCFTLPCFLLLCLCSFVCMSVCPSVRLSVCLSVTLSVCLSVCDPFFVCWIIWHSLFG